MTTSVRVAPSVRIYSTLNLSIGKLLEILKECDMDEDTIVIFSSDHGDMLGERGLWYVCSLGADSPC